MEMREIENEVNTDYIQNDILLAIDLLIIGIKNAEDDYDKNIIMRSTMSVLEFLSRNIKSKEKTR